MCYGHSSESVLIPRLEIRLAQYWYWLGVKFNAFITFRHIYDRDKFAPWGFLISQVKNLCKAYCLWTKFRSTWPLLFMNRISLNLKSRLLLCMLHLWFFSIYQKSFLEFSLQYCYLLFRPTLVGGGTICSTLFIFVRLIFSCWYIHRTGLWVVSLESLSSNEFRTKIFLNCNFSEELQRIKILWGLVDLFTLFAIFAKILINYC